MATSPPPHPLALAGPLTKGVEQQPQAQHRQRVPPADEEEGGDQQQDGLWGAQWPSGPTPAASSRAQETTCPPLSGGPPYPFHSCNFPAGADPPGVGALDGGHGEADEEKHLSLLQARRAGILVPHPAGRLPRAAKPGHRAESHCPPRFLGWAPGHGKTAGCPQVGSLGGGRALPPAELEALVYKEAECVLQAREQEEVEQVDQAQAAQLAQPWGQWGKGMRGPRPDSSWGSPTLVRGCSLLSPVGGSWPWATAEKRSRAAGLSRSAAARNPRVMEGAWQGAELERPAGSLGVP